MNFENPIKQNIPDEKEEKIQKLERDLKIERAGRKNIYQIARFAQMLRLRGKEIDLSDQEKEELLIKLENARKGEGGIKTVQGQEVPQGYEIARWLMLARILSVEKANLSEDDKSKILEAAFELKKQKNFIHLASLIKTAEILGINIGLEDLADDDKRRAEEEFKKM